MPGHYIIANTDKCEYLDPAVFGDRGLRNIAQGEDGVLAALCYLLANGGNGERMILNGDVVGEHELLGSWANDRIVIVGSYIRRGTFTDDFPVGDANLYSYATARFRNISSLVIAFVPVVAGHSHPLAKVERKFGGYTRPRRVRELERKTNEAVKLERGSRVIIGDIDFVLDTALAEPQPDGTVHVTLHGGRQRNIGSSSLMDTYITHSISNPYRGMVGAITASGDALQSIGRAARVAQDQLEQHRQELYDRIQEGYRSGQFSAVSGPTADAVNTYGVAAALGEERQAQNETAQAAGPAWAVDWGGGTIAEYVPDNIREVPVPEITAPSAPPVNHPSTPERPNAGRHALIDMGEILLRAEGRTSWIQVYNEETGQWEEPEEEVVNHPCRICGSRLNELHYNGNCTDCGMDAVPSTCNNCGDEAPDVNDDGICTICTDNNAEDDYYDPFADDD